MALAKRPRQPWLAALLSFLVPGLGQAYLGRWLLGVILIVPFALIVVGAVAIWLGGQETLRRQVFSSPFLIGLFVLNATLFLWRAFAIAHAGLSDDQAATPRVRRGTAWPQRLGLAAIGLLLVSTAAMHFYVGMIVVRLNATLDEVFDPGMGGQGRDPGGEPAGEEPVEEVPEFQWDGRGRINFLLVGLDDAPGREASLTDTILALSIDPADESAVMISIPRDTGFVPLSSDAIYPDRLYPKKINQLAGEARANPDRWCPDRLISSNADAAACGIATLEDTVTLYLGIPIHYSARIDLLGFERLIDAVGGIELCLEGRLVDPQYTDPSSGARGLELPAGCHPYDGASALAYARSRQGWIEMPNGTREPQNDFLRADRQQEILLAVRDELERSNYLIDLPPLLEAIGSLVTTDFPRNQAGDLASLLPLVTGPSIERVVLGYPEFVDLPVDPDLNYLLTPRRDAIRAEMEDLFGRDHELEGWYLAEDAGTIP